MKNYVIVFCTCPNDATTAKKIATAVVTAKLAACVNIVANVNSVYPWQGVVKSCDETLLIIKTRQALYPKLEAEIRTLHPYELPEIVMVSLDNALPAYLNWIDESTC